MIGQYVPAPSGSWLTMSWLARLQRARHAETMREHARFALWEFEGGTIAASVETRAATK
jgi:hypothetical protein